MERPSKGKLIPLTASNIYPNPHCTPGGAPAAQMSQPLPENGPPRIQRKFKIDAEEPSEDSRTERPTPKVRAGLPQRGTKNMRHGNLKIVEEEFKIVQYLKLPGTKQNFQGKTTTVTAQGRSSRTATQPRKKNIRKRKHAKTENMRR